MFSNPVREYQVLQTLLNLCYQVPGSPGNFFQYNISDLFQPGGKLEDPFCTSVDKAYCSWMDRVEQTEQVENVIFKHLKGQLDPPVSNVTFLDQRRSVGPPRE